MANVFSDAQIQEIMKLIDNRTAHEQYIGARYVPIFGRKGESSIEWDGGAGTYEPLTIVLHEGNSFTSRQFVPVGIDILNQEYWANTGNYNAQVEQYRQEVLAFDGRITNNANAIANETTNREQAINAEATARQQADTTLQNNIDAEATARQQADTTLQNNIDALAGKRSIMLAFGDSYGDATGEWADLVSKKLGKQLDNFCLGGAVWPFDSKLDEAIAKYDTEEMKNKIAFAVAYGGINQTVFNPYTNASTIKSFITKFNENFPNVPLFIAPLNNCNPYNTNFPNAFRNTLLSAPVVYRELRTFEGNFILLDGSIWYNTGSNSLWQNDRLHPNEAGNQAIANNMVAAMFGNNTIYQELQPIGNWVGDNIIIEEPGYITQNGIMTPRLRINAISTSTLYFASNGFKIGNIIPLMWYDYNEKTNETTVKGNTFPPSFISDPNNMQMYITILGLTFETNHHAIIPAQFIPFGIPTAVDAS